MAEHTKTPQCCEMGVFDPHSWLGRQCSKPGKVERDTKFYCSIHDPVAIAKRQASKRAQWAAKRAQWKADDDRRAEATKLAPEKAARLAHRDSCHDDLVAALARAEEYIEWAIGATNGVNEGENVLDIARAALAKANR